MARRTLNRKGLRADFDAAEGSKQQGDELEEQKEEEDATEAEGTSEAGELQAGPRPQRTTIARATRSRSRAPKTPRMKVVWAVFNNANQRVATFDYPQRQQAVELADKLRAEKQTAHFVQPVKEPLEEKRED
jgi:hypothetical protein